MSKVDGRFPLGAYAGGQSPAWALKHVVRTGSRIPDTQGAAPARREFVTPR